MTKAPRVLLQYLLGNLGKWQTAADQYMHLRPNKDSRVRTNTLFCSFWNLQNLDHTTLGGP